MSRVINLAAAGTAEAATPRLQSRVPLNVFACPLAMEASSSSDPLPEGGGNERSFPPTDEGIMRGWLTTHTPPIGQRLYFVLSSETLAYYESPEACAAAEPLGMLGIDEMQSVKGAARALTNRDHTHKNSHSSSSPAPAHTAHCSQRASDPRASSTCQSA